MIVTQLKFLDSKTCLGMILRGHLEKLHLKFTFTRGHRLDVEHIVGIKLNKVGARKCAMNMHGCDETSGILSGNL